MEANDQPKNDGGAQVETTTPAAGTPEGEPVRDISQKQFKRSTFGIPRNERYLYPYGSPPPF